MMTNRQNSANIIEITYRYVDSYLIYLAMRLGIFSNERRTFTIKSLQEELASKHQTTFNEDYLKRILRSLCTHSLLNELTGVYTQTELGSYLNNEAAQSGIAREFSDERWVRISQLSAADLIAGKNIYEELFLQDDYILNLPQQLISMIKGYQQVKMLQIAGELKLFDLMSDEPTLISDIAKACDITDEQAHYLLSYLAKMNIVRQHSTNGVNLKTLGKLMRSDTSNMTAFVLHESKEKWLALAKIFTMLQTGEDAFKQANHLLIFDYLKLQPALANIFHDAMTAVSTSIEIPAIVEGIEFSGTVMDMGGGQGQLLKAILLRHPQTSGIIFDLPEVIEKVVVTQDISQRCRLHSGSFFASKSIPTADTIILKRVLHDWDDEKSETILRHCQLSLTKKGRVLIIEYLADSPMMAKADLMMMAIGGKGRSTEDFQRLSANAGLFFSRKVALTPMLSMIELSNTK